MLTSKPTLETGQTASTTTRLGLLRFAGVALKWAAELLKGSNQVRHGVDLFGRDALVLGRLLITLVSMLVLR